MANIQRGKVDALVAGIARYNRMHEIHAEVCVELDYTKATDNSVPVEFMVNWCALGNATADITIAFAEALQKLARICKKLNEKKWSIVNEAYFKDGEQYNKAVDFIVCIMEEDSLENLIDCM